LPWWSAYQPGESTIHKAYPGTKLAWGISVFLSSLLFWNPSIVFLFFLAGFPILFLAKITKTCFARFAIFIPPTIVMFIFQTFFASYAPTILFTINLGPLNLPLRYEGFYKALWLTMAWLTGFTWISSVIMTTHPGDLFLVFRKLKLPYFLSYIIMTTLQVIPIMKRDLDLIVEAQRSRGLVMGKNPLRLFAIAVPLIVTSIERVYKMTWSIETRAFASKVNKTSFRRIEMQRGDKILIPLSVVFFAVFLVARIYLGPLEIPPPKVI